MIHCPNKNLQEWKDLVEKVGENRAYTEWHITTSNENEFNTNEIQFSRTTDPKLISILKSFNYNESGFFPNNIDRQALINKLKTSGYNYEIKYSKYNSPYLSLNDKFSKVSFNKSVQVKSDIISKEASNNLLNALSKKIGIKYNFITKEEARKMLQNEGKEYNNESAFYYKGQTYFTELNMDDHIHEFSHPLFDALEKYNPKLFANTLESILNTKEGAKILNEVSILYPEDFEDDEPTNKALKEIGVRALTEIAKKNINSETGKPFLSAIKRLFIAFKQTLRKVFGKDINVSDLNENTTLQELADMLTIGSGKINLNKEDGNMSPKINPLIIGKTVVFEHGEDVPSSNKTINGQNNSDLTNEGKIQAKNTAESMKENGFTNLISSPVGRVVKTAEIIKESKGISYTTNDLLATMNMGSWENNKSEEEFDESKAFSKENENKKLNTTSESPIEFVNRAIKAYNFIKTLDDKTAILTSSKMIRMISALSKTDGIWNDESREEYLKDYKKDSEKESVNDDDFEYIQFKRNDIYEKTSDEEQDYYSEQINSFEDNNNGEKPSKKLKKTVEKLLELRQKVKFINNEYIDSETSEKYTRVSEIIDSNDYYKFEGDSSLYEDNREWGNQIDYILRGVILGKDIDEIKQSLEEDIDKRNPDGTDVSLSEDVINELYEKFNEFKDQYKNSIILTQQVFYNEELKVAGTADVVIVDNEGKIKIIDLKSSINPTLYKNGRFGEYETSGGFKNSYNRIFKKKDEEGNTIEKASKKERHEAQLSIYKGLGISKGLDFVENDSIEVFPIHISETDGSRVSEINVENQIPLSAKKDFIEEYWSDGEYSSESSLITDGRYDLYVNKIKTLLEERLQLLNKRHTGINKFEKNQIERLQTAIETVEKTETLGRFVNQIFDLFVINKKTEFPGIVSRIEKTIEKVENGDLRGIDAINELQYYKETVNLYEEIIDDLLNFYDTEFNELNDSKEGSSLWKLEKISRASKKIKSKYRKKINPLIALELSKQISSSANESLIKDIEGKKQRAEAYKKKGTEGALKIANKLEKEISELNKKFKGGVSYQNILNELNEGSDIDLSMVDSWANPAISSSNSIVSLFAKTVKDLFEEVRMNMIDFSNKASSAFETFKSKSGLNANNTSEFNKGMYEKIRRRDEVDGKWEWQEAMAFVQETDVNKYQQALSDAYDRKEEIRKSKGDKAASDFMRNWYDKNTEPSEDKEINGVVISKGVKSLIEEKQKLVEDGIWKEYELNNWINKNYYKDKDDSEIFMREFSQPKKSLYTNQNYIDLKNDTNKFNYYKFLVSTYFNDQNKRIPENARRGHILPSINKNNYERVKENGVVNFLKFKIKDSLQTTSKDIEMYGEESASSELKIVPLLYHNNLPTEDVSLDLISSVMRYHEASLRYEAQSSLVGISDSVLEAVKESTPFKSDSIGKKVINAAAKKAGIEGWQKYLKKHNGNNIAALLEGFIDMQIYGKTSIEKKANVFGREINIGKTVNSFMGLASFTQIGGNPLLSAANYFTASANASIEAASKQFFTFGEFEKSRFIYDKHVANGDFIKDFTSPTHKTLIGQLIDLYDPLQGKYKDKYGRKISHTTARKLMSSDAWFFMQQQGEHNIQVRTLIAMLLKNKVMQNGKEINLLDAYELGSNGKIKLKSGVKLDGNITKNGLMNKDVQNSLHAINKQMHGVYDEFNKTIMEREWWGRMLMMYRKFVVPGFKRRYKRYGIDQEMGVVTEGFYRTFWNLAINETKELVKQLSPFSESNLTEVEKVNVRKAAMEMSYMLTTGVAIMTLSSMKGSGGDDDDKARKYALYFSLRLNSEIGFFLAPGDPRTLLAPNILDMYRSFRSPTAGYTIAEKSVRLASQLTDPFAVYKRKTGKWNKGDNKAVADLMKLIGLTGNTMNPDQAIKSFMLQSK